MHDVVALLGLLVALLLALLLVLLICWLRLSPTAGGTACRVMRAPRAHRATKQTHTACANQENDGGTNAMIGERDFGRVDHRGGGSGGWVAETGGRRGGALRSDRAPRQKVRELDLKGNGLGEKKRITVTESVSRQLEIAVATLFCRLIEASARVSWGH